MYSISTTHGELGMVDAPTYIYRQSNGYFGLCDEERAQGIAYNGQAYQLNGRESMGGELETVRVAQVDAGARLTAQAGISDQLRADVDFIAMMADTDLTGDGEV